MNERIKQLAEQAEYLVNEVFVWDPTGPDREDVIREKFAELIVRECCQFENSYSGDARLVSRHYGRRIREHFGVKE